VISAEVALMSLSLVGSAYAAQQSPGDLDLYRWSSLAGLHGHPVGYEGHKLDVAERDLGRRRAAIRAWLVVREGEAVLARIDQEIADGVHDVYYVRSPSTAEEWDNLMRARRYVAQLERRKRSADRLSRRTDGDGLKAGGI